MGENKVRGYLPDDDRVFGDDEVKTLQTAQDELQFLLDRGYPMKSAATLVGNHHQLTTRQALAVIRATSSFENLAVREKKRLTPESIKGQTVYVDGFNLIITLEVTLSNGMLFMGQDGCIRDLAELRGSYRLIPQTEKAISIIRDELSELQVGKAVIYLDQPVSNSGRLKEKIYELDWPMAVDVEIVRSPDALLKKLPCVVTSDAIILDECESWFNLTAYIFDKPEFQNLSRLIQLN